ILPAFRLVSRGRGHKIARMARFTSYGVCELCGKRTTKAAMGRHLKGCAKDHNSSRGKPARLFHLRIEDAYTPFFWMDVEMKATATLEDLDDFLRGIWLECCGHLSAFYIDEATYMLTQAMDMGGPFGDPDERDMRAKLGDVLSEGTRFRHVYDFGTSTDLKLRVAGEREGRIGQSSLRLLSRNEAPVWECEVCGEEATQICTYCIYETENPFYCEAHAEDHDCDEPEMLLPVVNSPRMGMCGYEGPL
ncbi:MAG: IS1096 element passenger TnpR family protein, partial [Rubrobacteraceae bacterium]